MRTGRAGLEARRKARRRQVEALQASPLFVAFFAGSALIGAVALELWMPPRWADLAVGAFVASCGWCASVLIRDASGAGPSSMGAYAETLTHQELRGLERAGWLVIDAVPLQLHRGDADHVIVGQAGVFVLETKWSGTRWSTASFMGSRLTTAAHQAARAAHNVGLRLVAERLRVPVHPVVVTWGESSLTVGHVVGDVPVVPGESLREWLLSLPTEALPPGTLATVETALRELIAVEEGRKSYPKTLGDLLIEKGPTAVLVQLSLAIVACWSTLFAVARITDFHLGLGLAASAVAVTAAQRGAAAARLRWLSLGAFAGGLGFPLLIGALWTATRLS